MNVFWTAFFFVCAIGFIVVELYVLRSSYNVAGWMVSSAVAGAYCGRWHIDRTRQREAKLEDDDS
jgi:hypothetical protein